MKRKKELIVILSSLLVIVLSVSVAYFTTKILGTGKEISVESADLKVIFTSGSGTINGTNIEPGWTSGENTFTVKNESNGTYKYNIIIKDLVNTFVTTGFLQYKITSTDGGYNMTDFEDVPKSSSATDTVLAENISIEKGTTHTYKIIINYNNSDDVDQSADMGKTLSGKIFITKASNPTLASKLLEDNSTISTRTNFGTVFISNTIKTLYKSTEKGKDVYYFAGADFVEEHCEYNGILIENADEENKISKAQCISTINICQLGSTLIYDNMFDEDGSNCENAYGGTLITTSNASWIAGVEKTINNWVKFANFYWRIIRTNADESIRLLYSGKSPDTTAGYIITDMFNVASNSPIYVGYMYGDNDTTLEEARINTNDSTIKRYIDAWYKTNLTTYTNYLSKDAVYCNDRELATGSTYLTSKSTFRFKSSERLNTNKTPTYDCTNTKDAFSVNNTEAKLKYPIALMTADEIAYAGGVYIANSPMWYYTNSEYNSITGSTRWWLLSPESWYSSRAYVWKVGGSDAPGRLFDFNVNTSYGVRPVVSLKSCTLWSQGNGSANSPYEIVENGGC